MIHFQARFERSAKSVAIEHPVPASDLANLDRTFPASEGWARDVRPYPGSEDLRELTFTRGPQESPLITGLLEDQASLTEGYSYSSGWSCSNTQPMLRWFPGHQEGRLSIQAAPPESLR